MSSPSEEIRTFKKLLSRLTPATASNEQCVNFVKSYAGDMNVLLRSLIDEMNRSSLNGRVKQLNFMEYCVGIVGKCQAPEDWKLLLAQNVQKFVDAAVPVQFAPPSLVNIEPARRFVRGFQAEGLIDETAADRIIAQINSKKQTLETLTASRQGNYRHQVTGDEMLRRMEDDRERAKKYKERELSVKIGSQEEFDRLWASVTEPNEPDYAAIKEVNSLAAL